MNGYVMLYRKLLDWEWFKDSQTLHVFVFMLLNANWTESKWKGIELQPGQLITSVNSICTGTGITPRSVRTCINRLISTSEITIKTTNKFTLVTVVNWALYQSDVEKTTNKTTNNLTNERQTNDKQTTTDKEIKELEDRKKDNKNSVAVSVVKYLNDKSGKDFDAKVKATINLINARIKEGATIEDFMLVIDYKTTLWKNDAYWKTFLRPSTLFAPSHFNEYLTEAKSDITIPQQPEPKSEWQTADYHREE